MRDHARLHIIQQRHALGKCPNKSANGIGYCETCWLLKELASTDEAADKIQDKLHELQRATGWADEERDRH